MAGVTSNSRKINMWFLPYGSDDESVIDYAPFTSSDQGTTGEGIGLAVFTNTNTTGNFNSDGFQIGTTAGAANRMEWDNTVVSSMTNGGHVSFEIEKEYFAEDGANSTANMVLLAFGNQVYWLRSNDTPTANHRWASRSFSTPNMQFKNDGMESHVRVDISWNNSVSRMYINYSLCGEWVANGPVQSSGNPIASSSDLRLCNLNSNQNQYIARVRNVQLSNRPLNIPTTPTLNTISLVGDSFTQQGQYPAANFAILGDTVDGYGDATTDAINTHRNRGMAPVMVGELAKRGLHVGLGKIRCFGRGGTKVIKTSGVALLERTNAMEDILTGGSVQEYPEPGVRTQSNIVVSVVGINDATAVSPTTDTQFDADYKDEIDRWDVYAEQIICCTIPYDMSDRGHDADIEAYNVKIKAFPAYNSKVKVVDMNAIIGTDLANYSGDSLHPSPTGQALYGVNIAAAITA